MPPKSKYTRDEVAMMALTIVKEEGVSALTARELGKRLGTSVSPIFTIFANMEEVKWAARELALKEFEAYISDFREYFPAFKRIGMMMVSYAIHEPELYKLLFMQEHPHGQSLKNTIGELGSMADTCIALIQRDNGLTADEARVLFEQMWTYTFGIGTLCAMNVCDFTEEEIANRLGQIFSGQMLLIKSGQINNVVGVPRKGGKADN